MKKLVISIALSLCTLLATAPGSIGAQSTQGQTVLKVLDINVWSGLDYVGYVSMGTYESAAVREKRFRALVQQIKELDPDVIGVHEANKLPAYARKLADEIGYIAFYHVGVGGVRLGPVGLPWNLREGDAILVKQGLQPEFVGRRQLSGGYVGKWATFHFEDATQVVGIKIVINRKPVYIYATHWHASLSDSPEIINRMEWLVNNGEAGREEYEALLAEIKAGVAWRMSEAGKTLAFIRETAGNHPVILMGDFNAESRSQEIQTLVGQGLMDTFAHLHADTKGYTWDPATNLNQQMHYLKNNYSDEPPDLNRKIDAFDKTLPSRIDYIFAGPQDLVATGLISVKNSRVVLKNIIDGVHASDHHGIYTEFLIGK